MDVSDRNCDGMSEGDTLDYAKGEAELEATTERSTTSNSRKRRKLDDGSSQAGGTPAKQPEPHQVVDQELVEHAKQRLSK